jgi:hypothetical protein
MLANGVPTGPAEETSKERLFYFSLNSSTIESNFDGLHTITQFDRVSSNIFIMYLSSNASKSSMMTFWMLAKSSLIESSSTFLNRHNIEYSEMPDTDLRSSISVNIRLFFAVSSKFSSNSSSLFKYELLNSNYQCQQRANKSIREKNLF